MRKRHKTTFLIPAILGVLLVAAVLLAGSNIAVLNPQGTIAESQRNLFVFTALLSLIIVVPVFTLTFFIVWKYRATNTKATYSPDWDGSRKLEFVWWAIPCVIIAILAVVAWKSSHDLDPYRAIAADKKPMTVQVIALQWKWLFIYPEQNIATVNYVQFPEDTPIEFKLTSDAPMNSFWIPQLGGQVYAMSGMSTKLHLMADNPGSYQGSSANISGKGFSGMRFTAKATTQRDFDQWVRSVRQLPDRLDMRAYDELAKPSTNNPPAYYASSDSGLYDRVIMKYMEPQQAEGEGETTQHDHSEMYAH